MTINKSFRLALLASVSCAGVIATILPVQAAPAQEQSPAVSEVLPVAQAKDDPVFEAFSAWATNYSQATPAAQSALEGGCASGNSYQRARRVFGDDP